MIYKHFVQACREPLSLLFLLRILLGGLARFFLRRAYVSGGRWAIELRSIELRGSGAAALSVAVRTWYLTEPSRVAGRGTTDH